jgi:hypothetical protein
MTVDRSAIRRAAQSAELKQNWSEAFRLWQQLTSHPDAEIWDHFGAIRTATFLRRLDEAEARLSALSGVSADNPMLSMLRAELTERRGSGAETLTAWETAAVLQADPYWALFGIARALNNMGQIEEARLAMAKAMRSPQAERSGTDFAAYLAMRCCRFDEADALLQARGVADAERIETLLTFLPGMTTLNERRVVYEAARQLSGAGEIVDLGCWLGSLTASMAMGVTRRSIAGAAPRIHAFDSFSWESSYMDHVWRDKIALPPPRDGETFLPAFKLVTHAWANLITIHDIDLMQTRWDSGPIDLLSIDAMKWPDAARRIIAEFFPPLVAGRSLVFQQDFCYPGTWWIHPYHFLLRDHFELRDPIEGSGGVLFGVVQPFTSQQIDAVLAADLFDPGLASEAFSFSRAMVAPLDRAAVDAAEKQWAEDRRLQP